MKNMTKWIAVVGSIAVLVLIKLLFLSPKDNKGKAPQGKGAASPKPTTLFVAKAESIDQKVYVTGEIIPYNQIALRAETAGKIISINFKDGELVPKGKLLVKINDAELKAQLLKNEAALKLALQKQERLERLKNIDGVSQEELDIVQNEVLSLQADRAYINAQAEKTSIYAPFSGKIGIKAISEGAYVTNSDIIAHLVQTRPVYVDFSLPEKYASSVRTGMGISFEWTTNAPSTTHTATITAIEPKIDATTKTLKCRATYYGQENPIPGSFVKVYANLGVLKNAILIPTQSIVPILKGQKVFVCRNGLADEVKVVTGIRTDDKIQVVEGIQAGDSILTSGLLGIVKADKLSITKVQ